MGGELMKDSIKQSIKKGSQVYTSGDVEREEISNEVFLFVAKVYKDKHGYIPKQWQE